MQITDFRVDADIVGGRVIIHWQFELEVNETLASIPRILLRRKERDFQFLPLLPNDPTLVYDSTIFPGPGEILSELPLEEYEQKGLRYMKRVESAMRVAGTQLIEVRRRTIITVLNPGNAPVRQQVQILDTGHTLPRGLRPQTTYYYQLQSPIIPADADPSPCRATATVTNSYGLARMLYEMLPQVYRRRDVRTRPAIPGTEAMPEATPNAGQLRRFIDLFGVALDFLRSQAEALPALHDLDHVDYRYLPLLADWIGWDLNFDATIPVQRNEIKAASALYRDTGTIPNLRALVNYYTGWHSQVAEFAQVIARANQPPQMNLYALQESSDGWRSPGDAALALGLLPPNNISVGAGSAPATLTTGRVEPFALRPGMTLVFVVDSMPPLVIQFWPKDFEDIEHARAAEVALVFNQLLYDGEAVPQVDGRVMLRTYRRGSAASLEVRAAVPELLSQENAPFGRLSVAPGNIGRLRLFYHTMLTDPDALPSSAASNIPSCSIRYKTFSQGVWRDSHGLDPTPAPAATPSPNRAHPAAVSLAGGRVLLSWIENPGTTTARIVATVGQDRPSRLAALVGALPEPFNVTPGSVLTFRFNHIFTETITFQAADFVLPSAATAAEVATALNARVPGLTATVQANRTLLITAGDEATQRLEIDLRQSTIARQLGYSPRNHRAFTTWDDTLDWSGFEPVPTISAGRYADLHAVRDGAGTTWCFWAAHDGAYWHIQSVRFDGVAWSSPETLTSGLTHNREPQTGLANDGTLWLFWAAAQNAGLHEDQWLIRRRIFDPTGPGWGTEAAVTTPIPGQHTADREPGVLPLPSGNFRLFFRTDRGGGSDLWQTEVAVPGGAATPAEAVTNTGDTEAAPTPLLWPDGTLWLLFRSDRSVALAQSIGQPPIVGAPRLNGQANGTNGTTAVRSLQLANTGTLRRFTGTTTVALRDSRRNSRMRRWDDLLSYTPEHLETLPETGALVSSNFYTPNTIGIYISQSLMDSLLTRQQVERLRQVLERAIPVNIRAVIILAPPVHVEYVYEAGTLNDIQESYRDDYPFIEYYTGLLDESIVNLPDWIILFSNTLGHLSANPADLSSLRRRSFFPPFGGSS